MQSKFAITVAGIASLAGAFFLGAFMSGDSDQIIGFPVAKAMSAISSDTFAACTAPMDNSTDGFFLLDFETGDLTGGVLHQNTAKFAVAYRSNVLKDLDFKVGGAPKFLMVPGRMLFGGAASNRMAQSVLYITDASTGVSVAYGIPWSNQQGPGGRNGVVAEFQKLDVARPRGGAAQARGGAAP